MHSLTCKHWWAQLNYPTLTFLSCIVLVLTHHNIFIVQFSWLKHCIFIKSYFKDGKFLFLCSSILSSGHELVIYFTWSIPGIILSTIWHQYSNLKELPENHTQEFCPTVLVPAVKRFQMNNLNYIPFLKDKVRNLFKNINSFMSNYMHPLLAHFPSIQRTHKISNWMQFLRYILSEYDKKKQNKCTRKRVEQMFRCLVFLLISLNESTKQLQ